MDLISSRWGVYCLESSRVDPPMLTASRKNLESQTFGEWYEEGRRLQRTRRGAKERRNRERECLNLVLVMVATPTSKQAFLSVSGVLIYFAVASFCLKKKKRFVNLKGFKRVEELDWFKQILVIGSWIAEVCNLADSSCLFDLKPDRIWLDQSARFEEKEAVA